MDYLILAISLGLAAGMSPGPLLTYTIVATLRGGLKAGISVGIAPLLTDVPIIVLSLLVLHILPPSALRLLNVVGGAFVVYLGWETLRAGWRSPAVVVQEDVDVRRELGRGVLVNFLNPNPYIFWGTVGGPILLEAYRTSPVYAVGFLVLFYALLVGAHLGIALLVHRQRDALRGVWYRRVLGLLGIVLIVIGLRLMGVVDWVGSVWGLW